MSFNWEQLFEILWILIIFAAPAIIGRFKKNNLDEEEEQIQEEAREAMLRSQASLGQRSVDLNKVKEQQQDPFTEFRNRIEELKKRKQEEQKQEKQQKQEARQQQTFIKEKPQKVKPKPTPRKEYVPPAQPVQVQVENTTHNTSRKPRKVVEFFEQELAKKKKKEKVPKRLSKANLRTHMVWKEILGKPKGLEI